MSVSFPIGPLPLCYPRCYPRKRWMVPNASNPRDTQRARNPLKSTISWSVPNGLECNGSNSWRTERDSNPRTAFTVTHFPGVRLQPLGHLSTLGKGEIHRPGAVRQGPVSHLKNQ